MQKEYYKPEEVMDLFKISKATLNRRAEDGTIPSELEEGRKRGRKYPKKAIDAMIRVSKKEEKETRFTFGPSTNNDLWLGYENTIRIYEEEDIVDFETLLEWRKANYDIFMTAKENGKRAGGITIIPIVESVILSIIDGKIKEKDIPTWSIKKWTDQDLTTYIPSISVTHTGDAQKDRERGLYIIRNAIRWAFSLDKLHDIKKWYAIAASEEGEKLLKHLGFRKIENTKTNAYILEDIKNAMYPIKSFLETLNQQKEVPIAPERKRRGKIKLQEN